MGKLLPRFIASALVIASAMAGAVTNSQGMVSRIYPSTDDKTYFRLASDTCNVGSDYYYFPNNGTAAQKAWFALLLLASGSGKPINVSVENCDLGNKQIRYLFIEP